MSDPSPAALSAAEGKTRLAELHDDWSLKDDATAISRTIACKGFAKAVYTANLVAWHADRQHHHPDISFGFGYCSVSYTTHDVDGLSGQDFASAALLDQLLAAEPPVS